MPRPQRTGVPMHQLSSKVNVPIPRGKRAGIGIGRVPGFAPTQAVRCVRRPRLLTQSIRDTGCPLDADPGVLSWTCHPSTLFNRGRTFLPDFEVVRETAVELVTEDRELVPDWALAPAAVRSMPTLTLLTSHPVGVRLDNAHELLRYAVWCVSLSARVRLLAAFDQEDSLPLAEAMTTIRHGADRIRAIAALEMRRFVDLDLDSGLVVR